jgi:phosphate starvation-inducible protein PhoH
MMDGIKGMGIHTFGDSDIVRNKILIEITERYEKWKTNNKVNW